MQQPDLRPQPISIEQFLPIAMASEVKLELIEGLIVAFAGGTGAHARVCDEVVRKLEKATALGGTVQTASIALRRVDASTYVFPDATYTREKLDPEADAIVAPVLVVEVMSPQSVERDRIDKLDCYQSIPSVQEYLIVDSRRIWACVYRRWDEMWSQTVYGLGDTIELLSVGGMEITMTELYSHADDGGNGDPV